MVLNGALSITRNFGHEETQSLAIKLPGIDDFGRLKELKLDITPDDNDADEYESLRGLRHLLHCVPNLEILDLGDIGWFTCKSVFPSDGTWPHLRRFMVQNLHITDEDLIHLLFTRMFCLQYLEIGAMELPHGTWESVIEALRFRKLSSFRMSDSGLYYDLGRDFLYSLRCRDSIASIERYVVHGAQDLTLRHPSLKEDQPTQDSLDYLGKLIVPFKGAGDVVLDVAVVKTVVAKVCAEANRKREMAGLTEGRRLLPMATCNS